MRPIKLLVFLGMALMSTGELQAQLLECKITAPSGMNVRNEPSVKGKVVGKLMYNNLIVIESTSYGELTIDDMPGHWRKIRSDETQGYIWDGYLEVVRHIDAPAKETTSAEKTSESRDTLPTEIKKTVDTAKPITDSKTSLPPAPMHLLLETYNYCGDVSHIDPSDFWYAIYPDDGKMKIELVDLRVSLSKHKLGNNLEFDIHTDLEGRSIFLIGTPYKQNFPPTFENLEEKLRAEGRQIMPGQRRTISTAEQQLAGKFVHISALGNVIAFGDCPEIENYRLTVKIERPGQPDIAQKLLDLIPQTGTCGVPDVYWYGDLNGDGYQDIIMVSVDEDENIFTLLLSDANAERMFYKAVSSFTMGICE